MKRRIWIISATVLAVLLMLAALTACQVKQDIEQSAEQPQDIISNDIGVIPAQVVDEENQESILESIQESIQENNLSFALVDPLFDLGELALTDLPTPPPSYQPEIKVIPLTSSYTIYSSVVFGPVAFINSKLEKVVLPAGIPSDYYMLLGEYTESESAVYGYIFSIDDKNVYLGVGGDVYTDFYPEPIWGADLSHYTVQNGYLITGVSSEEPGGPMGYRQLCGVMDLRSMKDILPPQYDAVSLDEATIWAIKGGEEYLFDYSGKLLMRSPQQVESYESTGVQDLQELRDYEVRYRTFPTIIQHDDMVIAYTSKQGISIFTSAGMHLLSIAEENIWHFWDSLCFYLDTDKTIIRLADGSILLVFADGQCKQIQLPSDFMDQQLTKGFSYQTGILTIYDWNKNYAYDVESGLLEVIELERNDDGMEFAELKNAYDEYLASGAFIIAYKGEWGDYRQIDVLNADGKLLMQDVLGAVYREPSFPGTMVVWLDETHCVLLDQNGNATPLPSLTQVEYDFIKF